MTHEVGAAGRPADDADEYRLVAERFVDPLFHVSGGIVSWIGPAIETTLGWTAEEFASMSFVDLCHPDDVADVLRLFDRVAAGGPARGVVRMRSRPGDYLWILLSLGPAPDREGLGAIVGSIREIDQRVRAEDQLRLIADHASNVVYTAGSDGLVTWVSPNVTRVLGWTQGDLVGRVIEDLLDPADREGVHQSLEALYSGEPWPAPVSGALVRLRRKDGTYLWSEAMAETSVGVDGRPNGVVGGFLDVHELVMARDGVRESEGRLRNALDSMLDAHAVLKPVRDNTGEIVNFSFDEVNSTACEYLEAVRSDILGTLITDRMPGNESSALMRLYARAMETGEPLVVEDFFYPAFELTGSDRHFEVRAVRFDESLSLIWRDVTLQRETAAALAASEEQYRLLAENSSDVVLRESGGRITWVSPSLTPMLGWAPAEWVGTSTTDWVHPDDVSGVDERRRIIEFGTSLVHRFRVRDSGGTDHWVEAHASPYIDQEGNLDGAVASFRTIDDEVAAAAELDRRARYDDLTGLLNRQEILDQMAAASGHLRRTGSESAVLFCDVDRFKDLNDHHGHALGDAVLQEIARRIDDSVRSGDLTARIGGDEFLVLLDGVHGLDDALAIAEKIRAEVARAVDIDGEVMSTSLSIGVGLAREGESVDQLVARADEAMFRAKACGRNRVITIDPTVTE